MAQTNFNFKTYNELMLSANTGLKVYLAEQMLLDVQGVMTRFKNPLTQQLVDITAELALLRAESKKQAEAREKSTAEIQQPSHSTSADNK